MNRTIQLYVDKQKKVKGYPLTSADRVIDEDGVSIKKHLKDNVKFDVVSEGGDVPEIDGLYDDSEIKEDIENINGQLENINAHEIYLKLNKNDLTGTENYEMINHILNKDEAITIKLPRGEYNISNTLLLQKHTILGDRNGGTILNFNFSDNEKDGIVVDGRFHHRCTIENLVVKMNYTGRNGLSVYGGDRCYLNNISIHKARKDGFSFRCVNYSWIENLYCVHLESQKSGRHGFSFIVNSDNGGNFINECIFECCEVRGVSIKENNGNAIYMECFANDGTWKISNITFNDFIGDSESSISNENGFNTSPHPVFLKYTEGYTCNYEKIIFNSGGFEDTTRNNFGDTPGVIYGEKGVIANGWRVSIGYSYWSGGGFTNITGVLYDQLYDKLYITPKIANKIECLDDIKCNDIITNNTYSKVELLWCDNEDIVSKPITISNKKITDIGLIHCTMKFFFSKYLSEDGKFFSQFHNEFYIIKNGIQTQMVMLNTSKNVPEGIDCFDVEIVRNGNESDNVLCSITLNDNYRNGGGEKRIYVVIESKQYSNI